MIKLFRNKNGLTQQQLADRTGLTLKSIRNYENGVREPNSKAMVALEKFFNVSGEVLRGEISIEEYAKKIEYHKNTPNVLEAQLKEYMSAFNNADLYSQEVSTRLLSIALKSLRMFVLENPELDISLIDHVLDSMDSFEKLNHRGIEETLKRIDELARLCEYTEN